MKIPVTAFRHGYRDTSRPWTEIVAFLDECERVVPQYGAVAALARRISESPFPAAGLFGMVRCHELGFYVGLTPHVLVNPHLFILYDPAKRQFRFEYRDGSLKPWTRTAEPGEAFAVLERFLTKRARWFRAPSPT
jgi:hypothetical protein